MQIIQMRFPGAVFFTETVFLAYFHEKSIKYMSSTLGPNIPAETMFKLKKKIVYQQNYCLS